MNRHDLAYLIEGIISFILIVVLSLFVNLQSANAKQQSPELCSKILGQEEAKIIHTDQTEKEGMIWVTYFVADKKGKVWFFASNYNSDNPAKKTVTRCYDENE